MEVLINSAVKQKTTPFVGCGFLFNQGGDLDIHRERFTPTRS